MQSESESETSSSSDDEEARPNPSKKLKFDTVVCQTEKGGHAATRIPAFNIVPVNSLDKIGSKEDSSTLHPLLPIPNFFIGIVAPTESGKTTLMVNLLARESAYRKYFDEVHIVSPTISVDPTWKRLDLKNGECFEQWDAMTEKHVQDVMAAQREEAARGVQYRKRILFIFDDIVGSGVGSSKTMKELATTYRWCGISVMLSTQRFRELAPVIRTNVTDWFLFDIHNGKELEDVFHECRGAMSTSEFAVLYRRATSKKYGFLHVSRRSPPSSVYREKFETILQPITR